MEKRNCITCKQEFQLEAEDIQMYEQSDIPPTKECITCTWKRLLGFWIIGRFRVAKSALSGKQIITNLPESAPFPIYHREEFSSEAWDPLSYGVEYDPNLPFLEQLTNLQHQVPHPHQSGRLNTNCEWTDDWWESKNCYLSRSGYRNEDVSYCYRVSELKNCQDLTYCFNMEQSYDCLYCYRSWRLFYSFNVTDSMDSMFLYDCRNCTNCFMSWNLRNKQYCILNKQYTKEEYYEKLKEYSLNSYKGVQELKKTFWEYLQKEAIHRENFNTQSNNCTGNFSTENQACINASFVEKSQNCRQLIRGYNAKDSIEVISCGFTEKSARTVIDQWGYGNVCVLSATNCRYSAYLDTCEDLENCFGCVGLKKKKYCILNKQYSKEEYEVLKDRIKTDMISRGEWGQFLPFAMSHSPYNMSLGAWMFEDISKSEVEALGSRIEEVATPSYEKSISSDVLPDTIEEVGEEICKQRIICPKTGLSYNISAVDLAFYKTYNIPLPQDHFDLRALNRFKPMTQMFLPQKGSCHYCSKEITHYYSPKLGFEKIACTECYQRNIS